MVCDTGTKIQETSRGQFLDIPCPPVSHLCWLFIGECQMKKCAKCKQIKPISEFSRHTGHKDGYQGWCKSCQRVYQRKYQKTERGKAVNRKSFKKYRRTNKGKDNDYRCAKRFRIRHPERRKAKAVVEYAVRVGKLPRVNTLQCHYCPKPAQQYHHPSYAPEHWYDVIPVCIKCHTKIHWKIAI